MRLAVTLIGGLFLAVAPGCATTNSAAVNKHLQARSLLDRPLYAIQDVSKRKPLEKNLRQARHDLARNPNDPKSIVWVGRRLGYLWQIGDAIEVFTDGIKDHPSFAPLYRHRGHRHISIRKFDDAIADLKSAALLIDAKPDEIEQDGMPNDRNIPLTTTGFNIWYHLALAHYLQGDFESALSAWNKTLEFTRGYDDNLVAVTDWTYMTLRRLGRDEEASRLLARITPDMEIIENSAYHRRCLMYKGLFAPKDLLDLDKASELDVATLGYGVGNWYLYNGQRDEAIKVFERVVSGPYWPAFGFIAAEADLARLRK